MRIAVIGTGYVGLVTGACFAHMGNTVICIDVDEEKIENLRNGNLSIYEPGLKDLVDLNLKEGRLFFDFDTAETVRSCEFIFIAVGTPTESGGNAFMGQVLDVAGAIGKSLENYRIVITKSTVPVGTAKQVEETIKNGLAARGLAVTFDVVSNPEFLKEGKAISDFLNPDRIIIGTDSVRAKERMLALYEPFCRTDESRIIFMDTSSAEMTKYAANAFLASRISLMNELAAICDANGANIDHVRVGIGSDSRIGRQFLFPGVGYGGSCFPKDVQALISAAEELGVRARVLSAVHEVNRQQPLQLATKIKNYYGPNELAGKTFAVWGLSFKPETDDVRESPAAAIIEDLLGEGVRVKAFDPVAEDSFHRMYGLPIKYADDMYGCLEGADALVLITEWHQFRRPKFDLIRRNLNEAVIFDGRNQYEPTYLQERGFAYISMGRKQVAPNH